MDGTTYDTYSSFNFSRVYFVVLSELYTLECNDECAKAEI